jgi:hypothetical protein
MFTANSMNCLTEALGLSLPGNGTVVATHKDRERLFKRAGRLIVDISKRYYEKDDASVLPRNVASKHAFENAMALDVAMGAQGCTATGSSTTAGYTFFGVANSTPHSAVPVLDADVIGVTVQVGAPFLSG